MPKNLEKKKKMRNTKLNEKTTNMASDVAEALPDMRKIVEKVEYLVEWYLFLEQEKVLR